MAAMTPVASHCFALLRTASHSDREALLRASRASRGLEARKREAAEAAPAAPEIGSTPIVLHDLARQVQRLLPDRRDPERFHADKSEIAAALRRLARQMERAA